uniref:Gag polyprotein n=2 Tax=Lygus hesperus TaxID=30085 RepID=A0A0A9YYU6_LYGHE
MPDPPSSPIVAESVKVEQAKLINEREVLYASLQQLFDKSQNLNSVKSVSAFTASYDRLTVIETKLDELTTRIRSFNAEIPDVSKKWRLDITKFYCTAVEMIDYARSNYVNAKKAYITAPALPQNPVIPTASSSQLPRIPLPTFSGKIEEWMEYHSLFLSLVHNEPSLAGNDVKKFQYLRSSLKGDAFSVIASFPLNAESYPLALAALVARFQNKRRLASHFVNRVLEFKPLHNPTHTDFQRFLNVHDNNWISLNKLENLDLLDFVKLHIALSHLDPVTRRAFEEEYTSATIPTHQNLIDFITELCRREELLKPVTSSTRSKEQQQRNISTPKIVNPKLSDQICVYQVSHKDSSDKSDRDQCKSTKVSPQNSRSVRHSSPKEPVTPGELVATVQPVASVSKTVCWNCDSTKHFYVSCPEPRRRFCYRCGYTGVTVNSCPTCHPENINGNRS